MAEYELNHKAAEALVSEVRKAMTPGDVKEPEEKLPGKAKDLVKLVRYTDANCVLQISDPPQIPAMNPDHMWCWVFMGQCWDQQNCTLARAPMLFYTDPNTGESSLLTGWSVVPGVFAGRNMYDPYSYPVYYCDNTTVVGNYRIRSWFILVHWPTHEDERAKNPSTANIAMFL